MAWVVCKHFLQKNKLKETKSVVRQPPKKGLSLNQSGAKALRNLPMVRGGLIIHQIQVTNSVPKKLEGVP